MELQPVVIPVPPRDYPNLKNRHQDLARFARQAVLESGEKSGLEPVQFSKDRSGRPLPSNGVYWSLSHKPVFVCGVVAFLPVGIDVEEIRLRSANLYERVGKKAEWDLFRERNNMNLSRLWSAKEAVLKALGIGLRGLAECQILEVRSASELIVSAGGKSASGKKFIVQSVELGNHIFSIAHTGAQVHWNLPNINAVGFSDEYRNY